MNDQCIVNNKDLTAIADSIRIKTGASEPLLFPNGFSDAINGIQIGSAIANPYVEETIDSSGKLTSAKLHNYVMTRPNMFDGQRSLASVILPDGLTTISSYTFNSCVKLSSITLPSSVTSVESHAFSGCSELVLAELPEGLTLIKDYGFHGCLKLSITKIPDGITMIYNDTFSDCIGLTSVSLPTSLLH